MTNSEAIKIINEQILDIDYPNGIYRVEPFSEKDNAKHHALYKAIDALRAQRKQGCERCNGNRDDWKAAPHEFRIDGNVLYFSDSQFGWEGTAANYCFNCGRKLDKEG